MLAGGPKTKFKNNFAALHVLKTIEAEGRVATPEEQSILARYVGWGGLPQAFDQQNRNWGDEYAQLRNLLTDEEWKAARQTTQYAHYTDPAVIQAIYEGLERMGFKGGRAIEPSMGTGLFIGLMPENMAGKTNWLGVEIDKLTGRIARALYPKAHVQIEGYQRVRLPDNYFDLAISNVPFSDTKPHDPKYNQYGFNLHNYFFAKSLDKVRPGGLVVFITSRYTMDSRDSSAREYMMDRADLIAAIRLPRDAFKKIANTEVVTDIIILRKREPGAAPSGESFAGLQTITGADNTLIDINEYFSRNPHMMLGVMSSRGSMYRANEPTLESDGRDLIASLREVMAQLPEGIYQPAATTRATNDAPIDAIAPAPTDMREGMYVLGEGGRIQQYLDGRLVPATISGKPISKTVANRIRGMIEIRNEVRNLIRLQKDGASQDVIADSRKRLNNIYDNFVKKLGPINSVANMRAFRDDPDAPLLASIETWDKKTKTAKKAAIFTQDTIRPDVRVERAENPVEAMLVSLSETGGIDPDRIAELLGQPFESALPELEGKYVFRDPQGGWVTAEKYLSGNVRAKLREAEQLAAQDPAFEVNVRALREVKPRDLEPQEINVAMTSPFVEAEDLEGFIKHLLNYDGSGLQVQKSKLINQVSIEYTPQFRQALYSVEATKKWGTPDVNALKLIEDILNNRKTTVRRTYEDDFGNEIRRIDQQATTAARQKQDEIIEEFKNWIYSDPERTERIVRDYNETMNSLRAGEYDGSHLTFPGMNPEIEMKPHQKNAVWRALQEGTAMFAHSVGAGKTFEMIATAMELKRIGAIRKAMLVVPNHLLDQVTQDVYKLYPAANVLAATKREFEKKRRSQFLNRIATGDWDIVVVPQSSFTMIPVSPERVEYFFRKKLDELEAAIIAERETSGSRSGSGLVKQIAKRREKLEEKMYKELEKLEKRRAEGSLFFEELGVDALIVDEAHEFKNLFFTTRMDRVKGLGDPDGSQKAMDLLMKVRYLQELNNGRGIVFATGTPIANSMAEMYHMTYYLAPDLLEDAGLYDFDAWASQFGTVTQVTEMGVDGKFTISNKFAKFINLPEMITMFRSFADVQTAADLGLPRPELEGGEPQIIVVEPTEELLEYQQILAERAEAVKTGQVDKKDDNYLKITTDARKAALDMRLVDPRLPDNPNSKINIAVQRIYRIWEETKPAKKTQIVFLDMGTPKEGRAGAPEAAASDDLDATSVSLYHDIRNKLVDLGIPREEIAFIHEHATEAQKNKLFAAMNEGDVRVLIGSTGKMGVGMNVQRKLIHLHHLDAPWRPADIEQREGRILRPGNEAIEKGEKVGISVYVTEQSFDSTIWGILRDKAAFIQSALQSGVTVREMEDISEVVLGYNRIMAVASGDPRVLDLANIDQEVARLTMLESSHYRNQADIKRELDALPKQIDATRAIIEGFAKDLKKRQDISGDKFSIVLDSKTYTNRDEAAKALDPLLKQRLKPGEEKIIGKFAGFDVVLREPEVKGQARRLFLRGELDHQASIGELAAGTLQSMSRTATDIMDRRYEIAKERLGSLTKNLEGLKKEYGKPFRYAEELAEKRAQQEALKRELGIIQDDESVVDVDESGDTDEVLTLVSSLGRSADAGGATRRRGKLSGEFEADIPVLSPKAAQQIAEILAEGLGVTARAGRPPRGAAGAYYPRGGGIIVQRRYLDSWRAIGHELGHTLQHKSGFRPVLEEMVDIVFKYHPTPDKVSDGQVSKEGFAEFFRIWLVSPEIAHNEAPLTSSMFEEIIAQDAEMTDILSRAQAIAATELQGSAIERGMNTIAFDKQPYRRGPGNLVRGREYHIMPMTPKWLAWKIADYRLPAIDLANELRRRGVPDGASLDTLMMIMGDPAWAARAIIENGPRGRDGRRLLPHRRPILDILREAVDQVMAPVIGAGRVTLPDGEKRGGRALFETLMHARRIAERATRPQIDVDALHMDPKTAQEIVDLMEEKFGPRIIDLAKEASETLSDTLLTMLEEAGMLSPETRDIIERGSDPDSYIPTFYEEVAPSALPRLDPRTTRQPVGRYSGQRRPVVPAFEAIGMKLAQVVHAVRTKRIMDELEAALRQPGMEEFGHIEPRPARRVTVPLGQVLQYLQNIIDAPIDIKEAGEVNLSVFTPGGLSDISRNEPVIMNWHADGSQTYMRVNGDLFRALMAMKAPESGTVVRYLARMSRWLRTTSLTNIRYFRNLLPRDYMQRVIMSRNPIKELHRSYLEGVSMALGMNPDLVDLYIQSGAFGSAAINVLDTAARSRITDRLLPTEAPGWKRTATGAYVYVANSILEINRFGEQFTRMGEFVGTFRSEVMKLGYSEQEAAEMLPKVARGEIDELPEDVQAEMERILTWMAHEAHDVMTPLGLHGESAWLRNFTATVPFLRGAIQGPWLLYRRMVEPGPSGAAARKRIGLSIITMLIPLSILSWYLMNNHSEHSRDFYNKMSSDMRDLYLWFPIPGTPFYFALRKPFEFATLMNIAERFMDDMFSQDPAARKAAEDLGGALASGFGMDPIPPLAYTLLGLSIGLDQYGREITPMRQRRLAAEMQYGPYTSETAKAISRWYSGLFEDPRRGWSPRQVQFFFDDMLRSASPTVTGATDRLLETLGVAERPEPMPGIEYKWPVRSLLYHYSQGGDRNVDQFFNLKQEAETWEQTALAWQLQGIAPTRRIPERAFDLLRALPALRSIERDLAQARSEIDEVLAQPGLDGETRKQLVMRRQYIMRLGASIPYGDPIPPAPPGLDMTLTEALEIREYMENRAHEALLRAVGEETQPYKAFEYLWQLMNGGDEQE